MYLYGRLLNLIKFTQSAIVSLILFFPVSTWADTSWEKAIGAVEKKSSKYFDYALKAGSGYPGTALNGIGHDRHICAIVGRMLGFKKEIHKAETFKDPLLSSETDPFELMTHAVFLDSWVAAARRAISMTETQKKSLWNLECVGNHSIPISSRIIQDTLDGEFSVLDDVLVVYGDIDGEFFKRFRDALDRNPNISSVALGSAGGSVLDVTCAPSSLRLCTESLGLNLWR